MHTRVEVAVTCQWLRNTVTVFGRRMGVVLVLTG